MKKVMLFAVATLFLLTGTYSCQNAPEMKNMENEALEVIRTRASVRKYRDRPVEQEKIEQLIRAAMAAPSGMDRRPWEIYVVNERPMLDKMAEALPYAKMLTEAPLVIVICGDIQKSDYWYLDCSAATQNLLLAAHALDLGAVWMAAYPYEDRMTAVTETLGIPDNVLPLAVIPVGYPDGNTSPKDKFDPSKVHFNLW